MDVATNPDEHLTGDEIREEEQRKRKDMERWGESSGIIEKTTMK